MNNAIGNFLEDMRESDAKKTEELVQARELDSIAASLDEQYSTTAAPEKLDLPNGEYEFEVVRAATRVVKNKGADAIEEVWELRVIEPETFRDQVYERRFVITASSLNIVRSTAAVFHLGEQKFSLRNWLAAIPHTTGCHLTAQITTRQVGRNNYTNCYFRYLKNISQNFKNYLTELKFGGSAGQDII